MENEENVQTASTVEAKPEIRRSILFGGTLETICMSVMAAGLIAILIVQPNWIKYTIAGVCALVFLFPFFIRVMQSRNGISVEKVCGILKKRGLSPIVSGDEIHWTCNGKESTLKIRSHCQVEISREYEIPPVPAVIDGNEKAALETMKEVYLAKVSVHKGNDGNRLAFSTESLCASAKELSTYLPMCLEILDLAEDRQREHIAEIRNENANRGTRRIGFAHPDGEIR